MRREAVEGWEESKGKLRTEVNAKRSENLSTAVFTSMLPQDLQEMVFQSQGADGVKYAIIRDKVVSVASRRIQMSQPVPMDVGEVAEGLGQYGAGDYWGYGYGEGKGNLGEEVEVDQIKSQGKGQHGDVCLGYGQLARECET